MSATSVVLAVCVSPLRVSAVAIDERTAAPASTQPAGTLHDDAVRLEGEVAGLIERRPDSPAAAVAGVDVQIDLRVISHHVLVQAHQAGPGDGLAECGFLRSQEFLSAAEGAARLFPRSVAPSAAQAEALNQLHQLTFKLPETKSVADLDALSAQVGQLLLAAGGPVPPKYHILPQMRPAPSEAGGSQSVGARTPADLNAAARQAVVSPGLRRQLVALAAATSAAAADKDRAAEASVLFDMLGRAVDIAGGLPPVGPAGSDARARIESQLTDGLALFLDPRMRSAGTAKLDELTQYRQMLDDVRRLVLPQGVQEKLGPAFVYAQRHDDQSAKLLGTVRQFMAVVGRQETVRPPALPPVQKKVFDQLRQQFTDHRQAFITDAAKLGDTSGFQAVTPEQLRNRLAGMQDEERSIELVAAVPSALQALAPYKPRPSGALDRRALVWISAVGGVVQSPSAAEARQLLQNLRELGDLAQRVTASSAVPPDIDKSYAHGHLARFNSHRADRLTEMASLAAAGRDVDRPTLARLQTSQDLADALRDAPLVETTAQQSEVLRAWVDWNVPADALNSLLHDYREATATTVDNVSDGDFASIDRWTAVRDRNAPVMTLLKTVGSYVEACRQLPAGWVGQVAQLSTPMDHQAFGAERYASLMLAAWQHTNSAAIASESGSPEPALILDALTTRLHAATTQPSR